MALPDAVARLPMDDLSHLAELIGDARVVAVGENNHHIREFGLLRDRILRFLVSELGFGVLAFESGFAEGRVVDEWIRGAPGDVETVAREGFTFRFGDGPEVHDMLRWSREHNAAGGELRFAGVDVPCSGGSALPALLRVREYLIAHAPEHVSAVDAAIEATKPYAAANNGVAPQRYAALSVVRQDAATAALTRLLSRLDGLGSSDAAHLVARHHALGALRLDEQLRELVALGGPEPPATPISSRDVYQAETVRLLRQLFGTDQRILLLAHNGHVQRTPMELVPGVRMRSAGNYLAADLGADYVAVGVTAHTGSTTEARLDDAASCGIDVVSRTLDPPGPDTVERAISEGSTAEEPVLLDLREPGNSREAGSSREPGNTPGPTHIRHATTETPVDVLAAFDGLICLPTMTPSSFVPRENS